MNLKADTKNIVIIGAGVTGCSIAYHLSKLGVACTLLERESIAERASGKAWATSTYPLSWLLVEMDPSTHFHSEASQGVRNWLDIYASGYYRQRDISMDIQAITGIDVGFKELFTALVANDQKEKKLFKSSLPLMHEFGGKEMQWLDKEALAELYPGISSSFLGALLWPSWTIEPYKYTLGLAQASEKLAGTTIKTGSVCGFGHKNGRVTSVKLSSGAEIEASTVVIAMGPWSGQAAGYLNINMPMGPILEQCIRLEYGGHLSEHIVLNGLAGFIPKPEGDYIFGISSQIHESFVDADAPVRLLPETKLKIMEEMMKIYPCLEDARIVEHRGDYMSWNPMKPYHKPVIGRLPNYDNAYIAARISVGMMASAGVGRIMSEYILTGKPPVHFVRALDHLSPTKA